MSEPKPGVRRPSFTKKAVFDLRVLAKEARESLPFDKNARKHCKRALKWIEQAAAWSDVKHGKKANK